MIAVIGKAMPMNRTFRPNPKYFKAIGREQPTVRSIPPIIISSLGAKSCQRRMPFLRLFLSSCIRRCWQAVGHEAKAHRHHLLTAFASEINLRIWQFNTMYIIWFPYPPPSPPPLHLPLSFCFFCLDKQHTHSSCVIQNKVIQFEQFHGKWIGIDSNRDCSWIDKHIRFTYFPHFFSWCARASCVSALHTPQPNKHCADLFLSLLAR